MLWAEPQSPSPALQRKMLTYAYVFSQTIVLHVALQVLFILSLPKGSEW
ncbi:hypothetical protein D3OALGA1CA_799 [Olavius algarvensis associated proteobacterium Delta 3]|nr:hypothetical protein D3OALGA1CA_799 [Olavius algarvensis associated proteobacterium Delta 3]CAB5142358.1 hypothetical protein D3OALGB2SA_4303 [Olavius algarvensis associated proteobacterium Delta 3]